MYNSRRSSQGSLSSVTTTASPSSPSSSAASVSTSDPTATTTPRSSVFSLSPAASPWFPSTTVASGPATTPIPLPGSFYQLMDQVECPDVYRQYPDVMDQLSKVVGHPVAVFEVRGDFTDVLITTSLGGKALPDYQKDKPSMIRVQMEHVPIFPQVAHHLTGERYYLADGGQFRKASYIKIMDLHRVPIASLRPFCQAKGGKQLRFAPESWSDLLLARTRTDTERTHGASPSSSPSSSWRSGRSGSRSPLPPPRSLSSGSPERVNQPWRSTSDPGPFTPPSRFQEGPPLQRSRSRKEAAMGGLWRRSV